MIKDTVNVTKNTSPAEQGHQVMDWRAAIVTGLIVGAVTLLIVLVGYPMITGGTPWTVFRFIAGIALGHDVLPPPTTFDALSLVVGTAIHLALSIIYTIILALIIHRWGILIGLVGGTLFGLALFLINLSTFVRLFDWFYPLRSWSFLLLHLFFGAVAGGLYELLERDRYVEDVVDEWS